MTLGAALLMMLVAVAVIGIAVRLPTLLRTGRTVVLPRPHPCSMAEAQRALDRLVAVGIDAEIIEHSDNGANMWANTKAGGEVRPSERYVIRVPRRQAEAASRV